IDKAMQPSIAAAEKAEDEVAAAPIAFKPVAEIDAPLAKLDESGERAAAMRQGSGTYCSRDYRQTSSFYRTIARVADALADGEEASIEVRLNEARNAARSLGGKRGAGIRAAP